MHEAAIAQGILDTAVRALPVGLQPPSRGGRPCVRVVRVVAGVFSGCERESLAMYFAELSKGTPLDGASLEIVRQPARLVCRECGHDRPFHDDGDFATNCDRCGGPNRMEGGNELYVESMEVEE